ncbi:MAG: 4'-phosphopantetheinyl transferase family protein [Actinomycetota bacterium]
MIGELLPSCVSVYEIRGSPVPDPLFEIEAASVVTAVGKRKREFALGRTCARRALLQLGAGSVPIPRGADRAPVWPPGVVGSITHCDGYVAAAVASRDQCAAIGIDAEPDEPLPVGVLEAVAMDAERSWIQAGPSEARDRVLFSAKESIYKAWYGLTQHWLGFEDALVDFDITTESFTTTLRVSEPPAVVCASGMRGRFRRAGGLILTSVVVAASV